MHPSLLLTAIMERTPEIYRRLDAAAGTRLVQNLAGDLEQVKNATVKTRIVGFMLQADEEYGARLAAAVGVSPDAARLAVR